MIGLVLGLIGAAAAGRLLDSVMFGVRASTRSSSA
jgi:hypothetical protein